MLLFLILFILLNAAWLAPFAVRLPRAVESWVLAIPAALVCGLLVMLSGEVFEHGRIVESINWVPVLGVELAFSLDSLSLTLALLITGIGALIMTYASGYLEEHPQRNRIFGFLYLFMAAMVGVVLADNWIVLFVFWELTSISSYLLIGFNHEEKKSRRNALQALLVTGLGGVAMFAGFILIQHVVGSWSISAALDAAESGVIAGSPMYVAIVILVLLGTFTKSAQFPFHFWLPNAMAAPTPVSAYLHSATMVKAGVFLMMKLSPLLGNTALWSNSLMTAGGITFLLAMFNGLAKTDIKTILACTTLGILGTLTFLIGLGTPYAIQAAVLLLIAHAFYKAALFMVAGAVDHGAGTRELPLLGGLFKTMPWTALAAFLAVFSMLGLPPKPGFLAKEYAYKAGEYFSAGFDFPLVILLFGNILMSVLALKAGVQPFLGRVRDPAHPPHEVNWAMRVGPLILGCMGVASFTALSGYFTPLAQGAIDAILLVSGPEKILFWHGINLALILSIVTVVSGVVLWILRDPIARFMQQFWEPLISGDRVYDEVLAGCLKVGAWQTRFFQSGSLRNYLLITFIAVFGLCVYKLVLVPGWWQTFAVSSSSALLKVITAIIVAAAVATVFARNRLIALLSLGVVGYGIAFIFAYFGAPDLAITQVLVETLSVVLFALVVYRLPQLKTLSSKRHIVIDLVVASLMGGLVALLFLKSYHLQFASNISDTLAAWSYALAHGRNVVNVILVDFRALDTFGEITVLAIASIGVWVLLKALPNRKRNWKKGNWRKAKR